MEKKHHAIKNTIISTTCALVLFLGASHNGSVHDFTMLKKDCPKKQVSDNELFMNGTLWVDLGYQGILDFYQDLDIAIPYKKPRKSKKNPNPELTQEQKNYNSYVGRNRIRVEHSIGGIKISNIVSHKFRGRKERWNDDVMLATTALYNYKKIY